MVTRPRDSYDREISKETEKVLTLEVVDRDKNPLDLYRAFQITRELRNAAAAARKTLSETYSDQYISLIEKRLRKRGLSDESIETALLTVKKSLRR